VPLWEGQTPCWEVRCDKCGDGEGHFDTRAELLASIEAAGWYVIRGLFNEPVEYYCDQCTGEVFDSLRNLRTMWQG
jgi:hypothetical protein